MEALKVSRRTTSTEEGFTLVVFFCCFCFFTMRSAVGSKWWLVDTFVEAMLGNNFANSFVSASDLVKSLILLDRLAALLVCD